MKNYLLLLLFVIATLSVSAAKLDNAIVTGTVETEAGEAIVYANVVLFSQADSSIVKIAFTDEAGKFTINCAGDQIYFCEVSFVGVNPYKTAAFSLADKEEKNLGKIVLKSSSTELDEVVVTAERALLEIHADKTVLNVDGSINAAGNDALELLRRSPGVTVDNNDNVIVLGKSGVKIYIDGKKTPLGGADLAAMLKNMPSEQIDAIEIITNPSAKYDAEGNAGIINIRLKKDKSLGMNGNIRAGVSYGQTLKKNGGLGLNYRNKKINAFGTYSYRDGTWHNEMQFYREVGNRAFDQVGLMGNSGPSHNYKAGIDYFVNKNTTIGVLYSGYSSTDDSYNHGLTEIKTLDTKTTLNFLNADTKNYGSRDNSNFNINYQYSNKEETSLNIDLDYGTFDNMGEADLFNVYKDANNQAIEFENNYYQMTPTLIDIYTAKADYEQKAFGGKLGLGGKYAQVKTDNTFNFYDVEGSSQLLDSSRSNTFIYTEDVAALYANYNRPINDKWGIQAGLRYEHTTSRGLLKSFTNVGNKDEKKDYNDFFPNLGISYQMNPMNSFRLAYGKRINRPNYQDLNPFEYKLDELTFQKGNPFLTPEYAHNVQLTYTYAYRYNFQLGYTYTDNMITRLMDTIDQTSSFITWENLASQEIYSLNISAPIQIKAWWSSFTNLSGVYSINKANFGEGREINVRHPNFTFYQQHSFQLPKGFSFELSGFYSTKQVWGGTFIIDPMWSMDLGVQKKFLDGKLNVKLSVKDLFNTQGWTSESNFGGQYLKGQGNWESQQVKLNLTYRFGNNKVKSARRRETGLSDEEKRATSGGK